MKDVIKATKTLKAVIKIGLSPSCFIYFDESPLKMMKNDFYFIFNALKMLFSLLRYLFFSWLFGHIEKMV